MKILVAMSGGVDSTVTAYLLKKSGHEVIGVNFAFVSNDVGADQIVGASIASPQTLPDDLIEISNSLGIKIIFRDFTSEFKEKIITSFVRDYENGITPNPCALCNGIMKFEKLLQVMKEENCDKIATGHYANVGAIDVGVKLREPVVGAVIDLPQNRFYIQKSKNQQKDQSYMLYRLTQEQLSHIIFPLSDMDKNEVRSIARKTGLKVSEKKDSQDVCFIKDIDYKEYIKRFEFGDDYKEKIALGKLREDEMLQKKYFSKGEFVDIDGKVLGFHNGIINYTIGQRKGLNIAFGERKFVTKIDAEKNQVVIGSNEDLMSTDFIIYDVVFSGLEEDAFEKQEKVVYNAKLRYRHDGTDCEVRKNEDGKTYSCHLLSPVRAITNGQSAVFYDDNDRIMFGGRIKV